jgi:hypothetical protein
MSHYWNNHRSPAIPSGHPPERVTVWLVADLREDDAAIAYAREGLGYSWGLISKGATTTGATGHWYSTLEECLAESGFVE